LRHWQKLTLFLRQAGAPLDNNICERALKMVVLLRKNALFYRTQHGAVSFRQGCTSRKISENYPPGRRASASR
jgi:Transposase IS66 family